MTPEIPLVHYTDQPLPRVKNKLVVTKQTTLLTENMGLVEQLKSTGNWVELVKYRIPIFIVTG